MRIYIMRTTLRLILLTGVLIAALNAWGDDQLPSLSSSGLERLPDAGSSPVSVSTISEQTITVTCYMGNPNDGQTMGSITVAAPEAAGPSCNSLNYSCRGRCFGCYSDFDLSEDVCVDSSGRKYLR
jgi:hypothetical protein